MTHPLGLAIRTETCSCSICGHGGIVVAEANGYLVLALRQGYALARPGLDVHDTFASQEAAAEAAFNGGYLWLDPYENADPEFEWRELDITPRIQL